MASRFNWRGDSLSARAIHLAGEGLYEGAEHLLGHANKHVPHDEGTLERSGSVDVDKASLRATVSYDTPYAARLHEHPEYNFRGKGRGKWLENAFQSQGQAVARMIAIKIGREL